LIIDAGRIDKEDYMDIPKYRMITTLVFGGILPVGVGFIIALVLPTWKLVQAPLHSAIEAIGLFAGITLAFLLLLQKKRVEDTAHYTYIAAALIGMGILDGYHSSVPPGNLFVWLHSAAVLAGGALLAMVWISGRNAAARGTDALPWFAAAAAVILGTFSVVFPESLPAMLSDGGFTPVAVFLNVFGGFFFVIGAGYFLVRYRKYKAAEDIFFAYFCLLNGSSGLLFPFSQPWLADWWVWHVLRLAAYLVMLALIFVIFRASIDRQISEAANVLASSVGEILSLTTQLASASAETAASVSETTSTVEEVKQTALLSAEKSKGVSDNAQNAVLIAKQGNAAVTDTMEGMNHIRGLMESVAESIMKLSEQTLAIGEIITVVNDLAQQSKLLSVNAAIEASKAGEHGKGFSVVAQEVKSLADQSKQATEQVRTILTDIQKATSVSVLAAEQVSKAVDACSSQANESGESIRKLAESISEAAQAATQIAVSSQQQVAGMEQVALAMESVKQAAQQNMTGAKQSEQAAHDLNELGQKLKELVGRYKV
jgi:hypothetical protein